MSQFRAIIADDEEQLRTYLKSRLNEVWPDLILCGEARNGLEALELIKKQKPDIAFLDIRMPGMSGIDVAKKVAESCWVVFITAYDQYAIEAFENEAVDYILKPITLERLEKTAKRLKKQIASSSGSPPDLSEIVDRLVAGLPKNAAQDYLQWIRVQQGDGIRLIATQDVCYFKAGDKYTIVVTKEGESLIRKPIKELADELDPEHFWQIHRGTIVNADHISRVSRSMTGGGVLRLRDRPETLTVSQRFIHIFRQM
ncbi:MAG TPA: LytTR family DNA-binding domain-containing protein [Desulfobacteraceae bacterium]|nr:LytTR family DNA-binding domain-containing protein [Desulfobacteraceae bacterium]HPJ67141.1 LytTR family DNA-binding domain-containing protein [Desulfobacteraceae bacterium]HPQ29341.1 LytTR family DNA-binding domain-containing protein [Desulfobacteraceae bacterium]